MITGAENVRMIVRVLRNFQRPRSLSNCTDLHICTCARCARRLSARRRDDGQRANFLFRGLLKKLATGDPSYQKDSAFFGQQGDSVAKKEDYWHSRFNISQASIESYMS